MGVLQSTVGFVGLLAGLGLGVTATRFVARYVSSDLEKCGQMLGAILLLGGGTILAGSLGLLLGAGVVADRWLNCPELEMSLRICSIWVFAFAAGELLMAALAGLESFRAVAAMSLLRGCLIFGGTIAGLKWGLNGSLVGWSLGLVASTLLLFRSLWRECAARGIRIGFTKSREDIRAIFSYAVPTLISGLSYAPFVWLTNTILVRNPHGFEQMALLTVAYQWRGLFTYLPVSLSRVALPLISSSESEGRDTTHHAFAVSNFLNQLIVWCCGITLLGAAGILLTLYGEDFLSGRWAFMLVIGGVMVGFVGNSLGSMIQASGLFRMGIIGNLLSGVSLVGCTLLLGKQLGAVSVGIGSMLGYFLNLVYCASGLVQQGHVEAKLGSKIVVTAVAAVILVLLMAQMPALWSAWVAVSLTPLAIWLLYNEFAKPAGISFDSLHKLIKKSFSEKS